MVSSCCESVAENVVKELEENLNMLEEIEGYLKIVRSFPLVSLNFLRKLKVIHGKKLDSGKYVLSEALGGGFPLCGCSDVFMISCVVRAGTHSFCWTTKTCRSCGTGTRAQRTCRS